ncbi:MAG TPA: lipoate--protein ligase family protein [Ignavibacteriales bacterium]|nr:lipoate--protein ligase family protein [Ignavibacteriales bacterium]
MKWHLLDTGFNSGSFNMEYDIELARNCPPDEAFFRLYRWKPYCISLGANQKFEDIDQKKALDNGIEVVKRPTGGRAILHAEELTYSVVLPAKAGFSSTEIYRKVSLALVRALKDFNPGLHAVELENLQPDFLSLLKDPSGIACFASTAKSEVKFRGKKLIGSAQRKMGHAILQHGSLLCGNFHLQLIDFLNLPKHEIEVIKDDLHNKTTDLATITGSPVDYSALAEAIIKGFETEWDIEFIKPVGMDLKL